jgi:putative transposase
VAPAGPKVGSKFQYPQIRAVGTALSKPTLMANTYTQIHIQCVFAVKYRQALIRPEYKERLQQYITAIVQNNGHKMLAINSMPDHLHLFFGFRTNQSLSDLMRLVKGESSEWINTEKFTPSKFNWQEGYGAFSYGRSQIRKVAEYIANQEEHHKKLTFLDEYQILLKKFEFDYDDKYIFKPLE